MKQAGAERVEGKRRQARVRVAISLAGCEGRREERRRRYPGVGEREGEWLVFSKRARARGLNGR